MKRQMNIVVLGDIIYDCFMWTTNLPKRGETVVGYNSAFFSGEKGQIRQFKQQNLVRMFF